MVICGMSGFAQTFRRAQWLVSRSSVFISHKPVLRPVIYQKHSFYSHRSFHTTSRRNVLPFIGPVLNLLLKAGAIITGRGIRKWWQALPKDRRRLVLDYVIAHRTPILVVSAGGVGAASLSYYMHLQNAPVTGRRRFIAVTPEQFNKIVNYEAEELMKQISTSTVPHSHPAYTLVKRLAQRLVDSNLDIPALRRIVWQVYVVHSDEINAMVLPSGHMIVNTGLLKAVHSEDQLAFVIAHEMSHAILMHGAEQVSRANMLQYFVIVFMAAIWAVMPNDGIALVTQWFYNRFMTLTMQLPYSRKLEAEADEVGLKLCAKACFDVRESSAWWMLMDAMSEYDEKVHDVVRVPDFLSTHPSHNSRTRSLNNIIPQMLQLREQCHCSKLPVEDPRHRADVVKMKTKGLIEEIKKQKLIESEANEAQSTASQGS